MSEGLEAHLEAIRGCLAQLGERAIPELAQRILDASHVYVSGAGRTRLMIEALAMRLAQIGLAVHVAGESTAPAIIAGDLLVAASGSGGSRTPLRHLQVARDAGARIQAVVGEEGTALARRADWSICLPAAGGPDNPYLLGGLFESSLLLLSDLLVAEILEQLRLSEQDLKRRHANLE